MASPSARHDLRGELVPSQPNGRLDSALGLTGPKSLSLRRSVGRPALMRANGAQRSRQSHLSRYKRSKGSSQCTSVTVSEQRYRGRSSSRSGGAAATDDHGRRS